jgi:hypothetical protein
MKPDEADIAKLLKNRLPSAQQETEVGKRVFYRLLLARTESPAACEPNDGEDDSFRPSRPRLSITFALSAGAVAALLFIFVLTTGLWRRPENTAPTDGSVLASNAAGRMLDLPDGSQVEMRAQSQLRIDHADDGLRLRLIEGSIIVTAAKQRGGHLYVETQDALASVVGTIFLVSVEESGSRAGVIEGVVNVRYGAVSQNLSVGQQLATNPAMEHVSLDAQISWSRFAALYLAMLHPSVPAAPQPLTAVVPTVAQPQTAAAPAAPPQSRPAASPQSSSEAGSLLVSGTPNQPVQRSATTPEAERAMEQALQSRETYSDLSFGVGTNYFQLNKAEYFVPVTLKIPGTQLSASPDAKRISLDIIGEVKDDYGTIIQKLRDALEVQLPDETAKELPARQIVYEKGFTLLPGNYSMKFLVHDRLTDRIGTYQVTVTIPNLNKQNTNLPISSVVLGSELVNPGDALATSTQPSASNPLVIEGKQLIPNSNRTFSKRRDLIVFLQAYEPSAAATEPLTASVSFYRGDTKVFETQPVTIKDNLGTKWRTLPVKLRVPLSSLPPGPYDCQVNVLDPATQKSAVWRSPIIVVN